MDAVSAMGARTDSENEKTPNLKGSLSDDGIRDDTCQLLDLAPELRNRIYRYVVCEDEEIEVTKDTREPGLLSTCRQIRGEARSIWFLENSFEISIEELDITLLAMFFRRQKKHLKGVTRTNRMSVSIMTFSHYSWASLMRWCKAAFDGEVWALTPQPSTDAHDVVVSNATHMAQKHRQITGSTWETCYQTLQYFRAVAGATDSRWLED